MTTPSIEVVRTPPRLQPRARDAHKGNFGRVLVVAGSRGMTGAAVLCASAALRGGAGLVLAAVPDSVLPVVAAGNPCCTTAGLPHDDAGRLSAEAADLAVGLTAGCQVVVLGPGLGQSEGVRAVVLALLGRTSQPLVLDADGLNAIAGRMDVLKRSGPLVLTPHPGEFVRLAGLPSVPAPVERLDVAARFAATHGVVLVLKGAGTVVTDGRRAWVNPTGNPGMATGGSGDVLAGLIGALLAQGLEPFDAARLGVYLHGMAGDLARDDLGEPSLIATDLLDNLPRAFVAHAAT